MDALKAKIRKTYGWPSAVIEKEIDNLEESIRCDERKKFARVLYRLLLDNCHLPVSALVDKVQRNDFGRGDVAK